MPSESIFYVAVTHGPVHGTAPRRSSLADQRPGGRLVGPALESVDLVTLFDESTPVELLKQVRPQLYVKGGDYDIETLEETRCVRSWGGDARALPFVDGYSTTALVQRIRR